MRAGVWEVDTEGGPKLVGVDEEEVEDGVMSPTDFFAARLLYELEARVKQVLQALSIDSSFLMNTLYEEQLAQTTSPHNRQ